MEPLAGVPAARAAAGPDSTDPARPRAGVRLSLRQRVFLLVAAVNVAVFALGGYIAYQGLGAEDERVAGELYQELARTLRRSMRTEGDVNVVRILQWPGWDLAGDAVLIDDNTQLEDGGVVRPRGVYLNPVGMGERGADFDEALVLGSIHAAMEEKRTVRGVQGGWAVPIDGPEGVWGGCWYRRRTAAFELRGLVQSLLLGYLLSTLLLTIGTFYVLRRLVLQPVEKLAAGAHRVRSGDLSVRLEESDRTDELAELVRSFNLMTGTVQGFNAKLEEEVQHATEQARRAEQAAVTQRRLAAMGELAAGIAHEINNPLGGLQNAVESLQAGKLEPERRARYLELLRDGLGRIQRTVGQLLRFTPRETATAPVDPALVCLDAVALVRHRAESEGVRLVLTLPGCEPIEHAWTSPEPPRADVPRILGARNELGQAILNLLVNALDALEDPRVKDSVEPRIDVRVSATPAEVLVRVEDNGVGVPEEALARLADLFYTTKDVGRGTGLGLAIVSNVVSSHGGRMLFENLPVGFRVELRFPRLRADEAPDELDGRGRGRRGGGRPR